MMMLGPKKKAATLIVSSMLGHEPHDDEASEVDDKKIALETTAEEILKAIQMKSAKRLVECLTHFWSMIDEDQDEEMEEEEQEGEAPEHGGY